jgi:cytochrome P450
MREALSWKRRSRPPGPPRTLAIGSAVAYRRDPLGFLLGLGKYGDVVRFTAGLTSFTLLRNPGSIQRVLVSDSGEFMQGQWTQDAKRVFGESLLTKERDAHRHRRRMLQPAFDHRRVREYGQVMVDRAERMQRRWTEGEALDLRREMNRLTLTIAAEALFSVDLERQANQLGDAFATSLLTVARPRWSLPGLIQALPLPGRPRFGETRRVLDSVAYRLLAERRADGEERGDLLSVLLAAGSQTGTADRLTDGEVRDEVVATLLAGTETTANALAWTWFQLATHPEVEARLHSELDSFLGGRLPSVDDLPELRYTHMVLSEALRLYPPIRIINRRAVVDLTIEGYAIPSGSNVLVSPYVTHHDPRFFSDPFDFDPQRWTEERVAERPRYAFFPFGGGPRACIGRSFALTEAKLVIATVARLWRLRLADGHRVEPDPRFSLPPRDVIPMTLERRG